MASELEWDDAAASSALLARDPRRGAASPGYHNGIVALNPGEFFVANPRFTRNGHSAEQPLMRVRPNPQPPRFDDQQVTTDRTTVHDLVGAFDAPPLRQLHLHLGKTRSNTTFAPTFYVPEDIFVDEDKNAVVQQRDGGYQVSMPAPITAYERRSRRRNSLESDDGVSYVSVNTADNNNNNNNDSDNHSRSLVPLQRNPSYLYQEPGTIYSSAAAPVQPRVYQADATALPKHAEGDKTATKKKKTNERPPELLGHRDLRRNICSMLIAPLWCCWPRDRTAREAAAFFIYYVLCNLAFFLAIVIGPTTPAPWVVAVLAVPTIMAIIRFTAAILARMFGPTIEYTDQIKGHVIMMVPCYTESRDGLTATLNSMAASKLRGLRGTIVAVCDGRVIGVGSTESCEDVLCSLMTIHKTTVYSDYTEYIGTYKGTPMHVVAKHQNAGKRDSQIRVFNLLNQNRFGKVDYIFMTDADCYFPEDSVYQLCWRLFIEKDTYASCGDIRVADPKNLLGKGQTYEYFLSQFHSRVAESYFATVTCLPGAFVCITTDVVTPELIRLYSAEPNSLHTAQLLKLGEDRYMTSIFMKLFPHRRAVFLPEAVLHTGVPETSTILKSQRRRWCMSAFHNMFDNLFLPKLFLWTRLTLVYDLITTWLQISFFMLVFYSIFRVIMYGNLLDYVSVAAGTGFLVMTMFTACIYGRWEVIKYVIYFTLLTPMLYLIIPLSNAWNAGNVKWGKTRQVSSVASSVAPEEKRDSKQLGIGQIVDDDSDDDDDAPSNARRSSGEGLPDRPQQVYAVLRKGSRGSASRVQRDVEDDDDHYQSIRLASTLNTDPSFNNGARRDNPLMLMDIATNSGYDGSSSSGTDRELPHTQLDMDMRNVATVGHVEPLDPQTSRREQSDKELW